MDDNILIEGITKPSSSGERERVYDSDRDKINAIHIIDFSDLSIGELTVIFAPWFLVLYMCTFFSSLK